MHWCLCIGVYALVHACGGCASVEVHACALPKMSLPSTSAKAPCCACTPASRPSRMRLRAMRTASQPLRRVTPLLVFAWLGLGLELGLALGLG